MPMERERGSRNRGDQFENERWRDYQGQGHDRDQRFDETQSWQDDNYHANAGTDERSRQPGPGYRGRPQGAIHDDDMSGGRGGYNQGEDDYRRRSGGSQGYEDQRWSQPGWMDERERHESRRYGGPNVYGDGGRDRPGTNYYRPDYWSGAGGHPGGYAGGSSWNDEYRSGSGYGGGRSGYRGDHRGQGGRDRGFIERAGDEVASWFGDDDAERRRERDNGHRGRGPKNYSRSDDRIREDVSDCLTDDNHIDASGIEVSVNDGEITLDGTVDERFAKRHAEDLAESVSGVKHVQNNLRIGADQSSAGKVSKTKQEDSTTKRTGTH